MNKKDTLALQSRDKSYSPYSNRKVGAVITLTNGANYTGCNVENSSFGGTVCAERTAVFKAVSEEGPTIRIESITVATDASPPWSPCGICLQVLNEFAADDCKVTLINPKGERIEHLFRQLLPHGFSRSALMK